MNVLTRVRDTFRATLTFGVVCVASSGACADEPTASRPSWEALESTLMEQQLWLNNTIGVTDKVPAPWEPIRIQPMERHHVGFQFLGRRYEFTQSIFPSEIETWKQAILAGPIVLKLVTDKEQTIPGDGLQVIDNSPNKMQFLTYGSAGGVHVSCLQELEYDGMLLCRLTLRPQAGQVPVRKLSLQIPLKKACAKYVNYNNFFQFFPDVGNRNTMGLMPELPMKLSFRPSVWLGNEDVGLDWFAESDQGWDRKANTDSQMEIFDEGDARILQVNFINSPRTLDAPRHIVFGFIATPAKPVKPDWHVNPGLFEYSLRFVWDTPPYYPVAQSNFVNNGGMAASLKARNAFKTSFTYMSGIRMDGSIVPEKYLFGQIWNNIPPSSRQALERPVTPEDYVKAWPGSPMSAQTDWLIWKWQGLIKQYGIRDIYFDSLGFPDINPLHGAGYVDENGLLQPTVGVLSMRRALQRFYVMCGERLPEFNISVHGGSASLPPVLSFAHAHVSGEQLICAPRRVEAHYADIVPMEEWIGYFMGRQFGVVGVFLPELDRQYHALKEPTEEMVMLAQLHDIPVIPAFCHSGIVNATRNALKRFGLDRIRFVPYWENGHWVVCSNDKVKISLYLDDGKQRMVLIIGNTSKAHETVAIELQPSLRPEGKIKGVDLLNQESFEIKENRLELAVKELNFRLISVVWP